MAGRTGSWNLARVGRGKQSSLPSGISKRSTLWLSHHTAKYLVHGLVLPDLTQFHYCLRYFHNEQFLSLVVDMLPRSGCSLKSLHLCGCHERKQPGPLLKTAPRLATLCFAVLRSNISPEIHPQWVRKAIYYLVYGIYISVALTSALWHPFIRWFYPVCLLRNLTARLLFMLLRQIEDQHLWNMFISMV